MELKGVHEPDLELFLIFHSRESMQLFLENPFDFEFCTILHQYQIMPILLVKCKRDDIERLSSIDSIKNIDVNFRCYLSNNTSLKIELSDTEIRNQLRRTPKNIGQGVRIALVDSGIDIHNMNLKNQVIMKIDMTNEIWDDLVGHGTISACLISEVAPKSKLIDVKVSTRAGLIHASDILLALEKIYSIKCDILLFGVASPTLTNGNDVLSQMCKKMVENGTLIVSPAGNFGPEMNTIGFPIKVPNTFCIGSINSSGDISFFSSRNLEKPDFYVVGENVTSCSAFHGILGKAHPTHSNKRIVSGTSFSAAKFAGILAITKQFFPEYNYTNLYDFFKYFNPVSRNLSIEKIKEKILELRPIVAPFKRMILISSIVSIFLFIFGISSIILFR